MSVKMLDLPAQHRAIREEVLAAVTRVLDAQALVLGDEVAAFERAIAAFLGVRHAIGVSSGSDALLACLMAEGIGPGDEVIVPDFSFFATAGSVARTGATPVFVDLADGSYLLDPRAFEAAIGPRTRGVIPVHLFGEAAAMDAILAIARAHGLFVIEDAAQAIGARFGPAHVGTLGDYGAFSFFPSKNLGGAGDGGLVVTNDDARAERIRRLRQHGVHEKHVHEILGGNFRLDALQAAILRVKLGHLDAWTAARARNATRYRALFADRDTERLVGLPRVGEGRAHVYNQFVVRCEGRDRVRSALAAEAIATEVYYPLPLHAQPCFSHLASATGSFPEATRAANTALALPVHPDLADGDLVRTVEALVEAARGARGAR